MGVVWDKREVLSAHGDAKSRLCKRKTVGKLLELGWKFPGPCVILGPILVSGFCSAQSYALPYFPRSCPLALGSAFQLIPTLNVPKS